MKVFFYWERLKLYTFYIIVRKVSIFTLFAPTWIATSIYFLPLHIFDKKICFKNIFFYIFNICFIN